MTQYRYAFPSSQRRGDAFIHWADRTLLWGSRRWRALVTSLLLVAAMITGGAWWSRHRAQMEVATNSVLILQLQSATAAMEKLEWSQALSILQPLADAPPRSPLLRLTLLESLAYAYEGAQEYGPAIEVFQRLRKEPHLVDPTNAVRGAVRCLVAAGRTDEAQALLQSLPQESSMERLWFLYRRTQK